METLARVAILIIGALILYSFVLAVGLIQLGIEAVRWVIQGGRK